MAVERGTIKKPFERAYSRVAVKLLFDPKKKKSVSSQVDNFGKNGSRLVPASRMLAMSGHNKYY